MGCAAPLSDPKGKRSSKTSSLLVWLGRSLAGASVESHGCTLHPGDTGAVAQQPEEPFQPILLQADGGRQVFIAKIKFRGEKVGKEPVGTRRGAESKWVGLA